MWPSSSLRLWLQSALLLTGAATASAQHPHARGHGDAAAQVRHLHQDVDAYIAAMESPERDAWQRPDALLAALALRPEDRVAEIGAGPGYFSRRLARHLRRGWLWTTDVEPRMIKALHERLRKDGARNVTTVLTPTDDPMLAPGSVDAVLLVDVYHHLEDRPRYLRRLAQALRPGGRLVVVDFHKRPLPVGPPPEMKLTPEQVTQEAQSAGLRPLKGPAEALLPHQYVLLFTGGGPDPSPR